MFIRKTKPDLRKIDMFPGSKAKGIFIEKKTLARMWIGVAAWPFDSYKKPVKLYRFLRICGEDGMSKYYFWACARKGDGVMLLSNFHKLKEVTEEQVRKRLKEKSPV